MTAFVLDCSIAAAWCFEDEASRETDLLLERLQSSSAAVPALWHWEIANVLTQAVRRQRIDAAAAASRLNLMAALPIVTDTEATERAWRETFLLAQAETLTAYDAAYLELALRLSVELATKDAPLAAAARRRGVRVTP